MKQLVKLDYLRDETEVYQSSEYIRRLYWDSSPFIQHLFYDLLDTALSLVSKMPSDSSVLDVGIAEGPFLPTLSKYFNQVVGVDINYDHIKVAQSITNCASNRLQNSVLAVADGMALPFRTNRYDIVFCLETLEHVTSIHNVLEEISRVLKKGGILISSVPIEIGLPILIRQIAGKMLGFPRDSYSSREIIDAIIGRNLERRRKRENKMHSHRFFSWRSVLKELENTSLILDSMVFTPCPGIRFFSTNVTFRAIKG